MDAEVIDGVTYYPFNLIFPGNKKRVFYHETVENKSQWMQIIKKLISFNDINEFYSLHESIGKGHFSTVRSATHINSGKKCAVKVTQK